ncbi:radical SAM protein [Streptomyces sulfonofaciens]|nr:aminofutalosine synthase MqnE [Streptomyces sulfonofaciens]
MDAGHKRDLEEKVRSGERLAHEDGVALHESDDLAWLGGLAHEVRTRRHGDAGYFTVSRGLTLTGGAEEAVRHAAGLAAEGVRELRITAGPDLPWERHPEALRALGSALPHLALKAFTAADVQRFERASALSASDVLDALVDAGLESFTGGTGGAGRTAAGETSWEDFSRIHRLAHAKGLKTPCTLLQGRGEEPAHGVEHLLRLRDLQDETGGFRVFAPLRPAEGGSVTGAEVLRTFAVSRLLLDNVPHIAVCRATHGERAAMLALQHGADEVDLSFTGFDASGTADDTGAAPTREDLLDLIRDAGFRPVERDGRYEVVQVYEGADPGRRDAPQPMRV